MPLITDPDNLSQGFDTAVADLAFTNSGFGGAANTTLTGAATLPAIATNEFFEIRNSSIVGNNGLYKATGTPTTSSITCAKVVGTNPADLAAEATNVLGKTGAANEKSVHFDTPTLTIYLLEKGNLSTDGVTMLALHSFAKEEWKGDAFLVAAAGFPMVGISFAAGQWQFGVDPSGNFNGWKLAEDNGTHTIKTRRLIRDAGWDEINSAGATLRKYFNVTTLPTSGAFEDAADLAYYRFGTNATDAAADIDFEFTGEVNEPVMYFREFGNPTTCTFPSTSTITRASGSFITDGYQIGGKVTSRASATGNHNGTKVLTNVEALTLTVTGTPFTANGADTLVQLAVDNSNVFEAFLRVRDGDTNGKTFSSADLAAGGETAISSKIIKLGLGNVTDLNVSETDANIVANTPYTEIRLRYLAAAYNREVDSATPRNFGIIVDVGTYSRHNGASNTTTLFTSASHTLGVGEALADYAGGQLIIHEGADKGTHTISGTPVNNAGTLEITVTVALTATAGSLSFTVQRATPIVASKKQIYEKIHYQLRQSSDIDETGSVVIGRTADDIAGFSGADLQLGKLLPTNPNGGGSGVIIEGFDSNDTNNLFFWDNSAVSRNYPFVAAGNIVVNQGLVDDTDGEAWLFYEYTRRTTNGTIDCIGNSGSTYDLEGTLGTYVVNDYLYITGFAQSANNGLFRVTVVNVSTSDYTVVKVDGTAVGTTESNQTVNVDEHPYPSPGAIIVDDNSDADIAFNISALSTAFTYDYENNVQGGRTANTNAAVVLVAAGLETGQVAIVKGLTITKTTGLTFSVTSALERNYSNV